MVKVNLVPKEGEPIEVEEEIIIISDYVKSWIKEGGTDKDIPLPLVEKAILEKVISFCEHHKEEPLQDIEKPLKTNNIRDVVSPWYGDFVDLEIKELCEIIVAADYYDIKPLIELTGAKVGSIMRGKSYEEIREQFNIEKDITSEELEQFRKENKWAEE